MKKVINKQKPSSVIDINRSNMLNAEIVDKKSSENIQAVNDTLAKGLNEETGNSLNSNVIKLFKEVQKQTSILKQKPKDTGPIIGAERAKGITNRSLGEPQYKTIGERTTDIKKGFKDFFTLKGFLNKTGIVDKDSTGIVGTAINRRAARKQYAEDRMKVDPNYWRIAKGDTDKEKKANARKTFEKQFDKQQEIKSQQRQNEGEISRLKEGGYTEEQIKRSGLLKTREGLAEKMTTVDSRFRERGADKSTVAGNTKKQLEVESKKKQKDKETIKEAMEFSDEGQLENQRQMETQTELLTRIAENTDGLRKGTKEDESKKAGESSGGGLLDTIMGFLGRGFMKALKFIFSPKNLLKAFTKVFLPVMIIGSLVNGIMDGFNKFMETGDIGEALIAGLGGILSFLTFGLFDAKTIKNVVDAVGGFITDYIIEPLKNFIGFIGDAFETYIMQPIMEAFDYIGNLFTEFIVEPVKKFFAPVANFFKKIKDQVFGFLEDFGIPEIGFTIPGIGKKVSIGPFYPFRPSEDTSRVASNTSVSASSTPSGTTETMRQSIQSTSADSSQVLVGNERTSTGADGRQTAEVAQSFANFDVKTGKATYAPGSGGEAVDISASTFIKVKAAAKLGADTAKLDEIVKEDKAYEQLSFWDKRKVDVGYAKASDLLSARQSTSTRQADAVYNQSSQNAAAAVTPPPAPAPVVVNAPTNVSNNRQNIALPQSVRNPDNGFNRYTNSRAVVL